VRKSERGKINNNNSPKRQLNHSSKPTRFSLFLSFSLSLPVCFLLIFFPFFLYVLKIFSLMGKADFILFESHSHSTPTSKKLRTAQAPV